MKKLKITSNDIINHKYINEIKELAKNYEQQQNINN